MAKKKAGGSTSLGRDSISKRLGVKKYDGQYVEPGMIIVRQRGTKFRPGENTKLGKDHTIYASGSGVVKFQEKKVKRYTGALNPAKFVHVISQK